ncbi:MFS transporter [Leucobacter soli]|uniref:Multidrug-efflux transporter n=2 Tax=Leucobacter soli TaxID=2812850 RepID=A0A916NVA8_9MICO|nr:MFS transporter [Leucobacter soli]CAG7605013.1 putative multidrug-efflux transporter [Leucobacter soli]
MTEPLREPTAPETGSWRELFGRGNAGTVFVLAGGVLVYAMNSFLTAALLPGMIDDLGGRQYFAWVVTVFLVAAVLASMLVARLLGTFGAARAYLVAYSVFAFGALTTAISPNMETLLATRVLQGLGCGLLVGLGFAVIKSALPERLWTRATGVTSGMWGVGVLIGPVFGGLFAQFGMWRIAYLSFFVFAVALGLLAIRALPSGRVVHGSTSPLPVWSLAIVVLATVAFSSASIVPTGVLTAAGMGAGALLLVLFVVVERRSVNAVLPRIAYLRGNPLKWIYLTLAILSSGAMIDIYLPYFALELAGLSPLISGLFGGAIAIGWSVSQVYSAGLDAPRSQRIATVLGAVLMAVGLLAYTLTQRDGEWWIALLWLLPLIVIGAGIGLAFPHLSAAALRSTDDPEEGAKAAAGVSTVELVANAIASALVGVLVAVGGPVAASSATVMGGGITLLGLVGVATAVLAIRPRARA